MKDCDRKRKKQNKDCDMKQRNNPQEGTELREDFFFFNAMYLHMIYRLGTSREREVKGKKGNESEAQVRLWALYFWDKYSSLW